MNYRIEIDCDRCLESIAFELRSNNPCELISARELRALLEENNWHYLKNCLCPSCEKLIGENNCLTCKHYEYHEYNHRCSKDEAIVSQRDNCKEYERSK